MFEPIVHEPLRFSVGPRAFTGLGLALGAAVVLVHVILRRELWRQGGDPALATSLLLWVAIGSALGAKVYGVVITGRAVGDLSTWGGGFSGILVGAGASAALWARRSGRPFASVADMLALGLAAGYPVGRTGCWAVGDDYGLPWNGWGAVAFPHGAPPSTAATLAPEFGVTLPAGTAADAVVAVHPTQLYETGAGLLMFAVVWWYRQPVRAPGTLAALYGVLLGTERFAMDFLRAKNDRVWGPITVTQIVALALAVAAAVAWSYVAHRHAAQPPGERDSHSSLAGRHP